MIDTAVLLLNQEGQPCTQEASWIWTPVGGVPLIERHLMSLKIAGLNTVHIVCREQELLTLEKKLPFWNQDTRFPRISMRTASTMSISDLPDHFLVLEGHKIFHPDLLMDAISRPGTFACAFEDNEPAGIGIGTPSLPLGDFSIDGICRMPLPQGLFVQNVLHCQERKRAERLLFQSLKKDTDGWIATHMNRPISLAISRFLVRYPIHPNLMTFISSLVGILSGVLSAFGTYGSMALGGALFHLASIMDGLDGEIARAKFLSSRSGEWFDTISDETTNLVYLAGVSLGNYRLSASKMNLWLGAITLVFYLLTIFLLYSRLLTTSRSASLLFFQEQIHTAEFKKKRASPLISALQPVIKRDFYAFFFMVFAVLGIPMAILISWLTAMVITTIVFLSHMPKINPTG